MKVRTPRHSPTYPGGRTPDRRGGKPPSSPRRSLEFMPGRHDSKGRGSPGRGPCHPRIQPDRWSDPTGIGLPARRVAPASPPHQSARSGSRSGERACKNRPVVVITGICQGKARGRRWPPRLLRMVVNQRFRSGVHPGALVHPSNSTGKAALSGLPSTCLVVVVRFQQLASGRSVTG